MSGKKIILMILLFAVLVGSVAAGLIWHKDHYIMVDFTLYSKDAESLDLREEALSIRGYEKMSQALPDCEILWNVPFQNTAYPENVTEITVTTLAEKDLESLKFLPELEMIHADQCREYALLARIREEYPQLRLEYDIVFSDGTEYDEQSSEITVRQVGESDVQLLQYFPSLKRIVIEGGGKLEALEAFRGTAHNLGVEFGIRIGDRIIADTETAVELPGLKEEDLPLLEQLVSMQSLHIRNPRAAASSLVALREVYPNVKITWEVEMAGQTYGDSVTEVDLSAVVVKDLTELEQQMEYLPDAKMLTLGLCGLDNAAWGSSRSTLAVCEIDNEDLAAYRDRVRDRYKVAWTVRIGPRIALRTDVDNFVPSHPTTFNVGRMTSAEAYNLRYCEDMVTLDLGHMDALTDVGFLEFMPKLRYLILAHSGVQYVEPIRHCKELIYLELDHSNIRDYSPLVDLTALEDLNIGKTYGDITPILEMTWLKNLWMIQCSTRSAYTATQTLTDTHVVVSGSATVANGWRHLQNYYDMRDNLGVPYMDW